jgi:hypothetical protein
MTVTLCNAGAKDRPETDFYATPEAVTHALLDWLNLPMGTRIWECAAGDGRMVEVMLARGYQVESSDIKTGVDFRVAGARKVDWIITNPPFIVAEDFIRHAYDLNPTGFAFLLKSQYWHSMKRNKLFFDIRPIAVLPLSWRPDFLFGKKSGAPTMEVLWTVWESPYGQKTIYEPLAKPK